VQKVNIHEKFSKFEDKWKPMIVGKLNQQYVKLVKIQGEFPWHFHESEDELFYVIEGMMTLRTRETQYTLQKDEFIIIPKGIEHSPAAKKETLIMLFEPRTTLNTGNVENKFTHTQLNSI
jgi:mannose-6-phosphate isomerase-like protein (cupin superfamily)